MINRRSFTLIETLVAVSLFVIVVVIGLAAVVVLTNTRTKASTIANTQQSGKLAMETMANEVEAVSDPTLDTINPSDLYNSVLNPTANPSYFSVTRNGIKEAFGLYNSTTQVSGSACTAGPCYIGMTAGGVISRLTSPDVSVTSLTFSGVPTNSSADKAYVYIDMTLQTGWTGADTQTLSLHTIAVPMQNPYHP